MFSIVVVFAGSVEHGMDCVTADNSCDYFMQNRYYLIYRFGVVKCAARALVELSARTLSSLAVAKSLFGIKVFITVCAGYTGPGYDVGWPGNDVCAANVRQLFPEAL